MDLHNNVNKIIESSSELFAAYGFDGTSISEICKAGNISKGRFYYYFNDKEDLFISCCKHAYSLADEVFTLFEFDEELSLIENLLNLFKCYQQVFEKYSFIPYMVYTINSSPPYSAKEARLEIGGEHQHRFIALIKDILEQCSLNIDVFHVSIAFHTSFMSTYARSGISGYDEIRLLIGNDAYKSFNYYLDKLLFGVIPRDEETMNNPKAARNT